MLAENTEIDHRTSWREAKEILGEQSRFNGVEDEREREELFNDFIQELSRKEKQAGHESRAMSSHLVHTFCF
jgi:pre-mRNA-processing factor 40